ncbi:hypothetical protein CEXT_28931 [Caerostris extrusa]|uniref:Uncharacterized protein n=1 Tax=Caerostris extrusa TaxID=172846 RepID=A0AAV4YAB3_CAEEX|nr:hypothetical protein CEXT_28931 [Caerostris extrusa]
MNFGLSFGELWPKTHLNIVSVQGKSNFKGLFLPLHFYAQFIVTTQSTEPSSRNEDTMYIIKRIQEESLYLSWLPVAVASVFRILFLPAIANRHALPFKLQGEK